MKKVYSYILYEYFLAIAFLHKVSSYWSKTFQTSRHGFCLVLDYMAYDVILQVNHLQLSIAKCYYFLLKGILALFYKSLFLWEQDVLTSTHGCCGVLDFLSYDMMHTFTHIQEGEE